MYSNLCLNSREKVPLITRTFLKPPFYKSMLVIFTIYSASGLWFEHEKLWKYNQRGLSSQVLTCNLRGRQSQMNELYLDEPANWKPRILRQIHTADPDGMRQKVAPVHNIPAQNPEISCVYLAQYPRLPLSVLIFIPITYLSMYRQMNSFIKRKNSSYLSPIWTTFLSVA